MSHHDKMKYIKFKGNLLEKILETANFKKYYYHYLTREYYFYIHPMFTLDMINEYFKKYIGIGRYGKECVIISKHMNILYDNDSKHNNYNENNNYNKYIDYHYIRHLEDNPNIDKNFIESNIENLYSYGINKNTNIYVNFISSNIMKFEYDLLFSNPVLSMEFIERHIKNDKSKILWDEISANPSLTIKFIEKNKANINWPILSKNIYLTIEIFDKYIDELIKNISELILNPTLTYDLCIKYKIKKEWKSEVIPYDIKKLELIKLKGELTKEDKALIKYIQDDPFVGDEILELIEKFPEEINWEKIFKNKYYYNNEVYSQLSNIDIQKKRKCVKNIFNKYISNDISNLISLKCYYN